MFSLESYKVLHLMGLVLLFLALGGMMFGPRRTNGKLAAAPMALHGVAIVVMLIAGFGMMARKSIEWPWDGWLFCKLAIWIVLGVYPVLIRRRVFPGSVLMIVAVGLVGLAAWFVLAKPF